mmetsp:Transcript_34090/g.64891  ORF Transcript_34090/g.64891 Transcript_34090/m.64891 type:complete len:371 (+) Transcript_34090:108-1220(+)
MRTIRQRRSLIILAIAVATRAGHSSANRGWARFPPPNFQRVKSLRPNININSSAISDKINHTPASIISLSLRGGSSTSANEDECATEDDDDAEEMRRQKREEHEKLVKYRTEQQMLYQLRSTYLTEMLASRGVPLPTIMSVSTADGEKPPEKVDWDCALSTDDDPKSCLYSFDAEPDTKVVAPLGTDQWISLSALNRLRRTDPTKVEPMWHSRYSILQSWFSDESEFSMLQHVGAKGFFVSSVLLDGGNGMVLRSLLVLSVLSALVLLMPLLEFIVGRIIVSAPFWAQWATWGRIARAGFPLKLLIGQMAWKAVASCFSKFENEVREYIVDLECEILESSVPVTVGVGSEEEIMDEEDFDEYDDEYDDEY